LRCLETATIALEGFENLQVFVHPLLSENVCGVTDISINFNEKENRFKHFSWKLFDEYYKENKEYYYLDFIDNKAKTKETIDFLKGNFKENIEKFLRNCCEQSEFGPETLSALFKRQENFKAFLRNFNKENKLNDGEVILVFSHYNFIRLSSSKQVYSMTDITEFPNDSASPKNCEIFSINI